MTENEGPNSTQVQRQCVELGQACEILCGSILTMEKRLKSVLKLGPNNVGDEHENKQESLVPLAEFLRDRTIAIRSAAERLDVLRHRLEL